MSLLYEMFGIREAGVQNAPADVPKAKKRRSFATDPQDRDDDDDAGGDEDDVPEFGTSELPDEEPEPEFGASEEEPAEDEADPDDELDPRNDRKFASEPQRPKAAPAAQGLSISGDAATLSQLRDALDQLSGMRGVDADLADWLDECVRAIDMAGRRHEPTVSLPKFTATPDLDDDFDDSGSDDDYED